MSVKRAMAVLVIFVLGIVQPVTSVKAQGPQEGIKVHGHWIIDVRNPDGTLAQHHEFENGLAFDGTTLAQALGHVNAAGRWQIFLSSVTNRVPCVGNRPDGTIGPYFCRILESNSTAPASPLSFFKTLTVGVSNAVAIQLKGTATAAIDGQIDEVGTALAQCATNIAVDSCNDWSSGYFPVTQTDLPVPIPVVKGQIVQVQVTISFS